MMFLLLRILGVKNKKKGLKTDMEWLEIWITVATERLTKRAALRCWMVMDGH